MPPFTNILDCQQKARQQYDAAFYLMHATFPVIRDPKLLIGVVYNLAQAYEHAIDAVLAYERQLRLIPPYPNDPKYKLNLFRDKTMRRNKISPEYITLFLELKDLIELKNKCPVEFQRGNRYILCSKNYRMKNISLKEIKNYLTQTKEFLTKIEQIIRYK
ncbi:MAG: hypothetical protein KKH52_02150 [Nanoarchaeota archaeon]|nr:hypothetical protein [Nanoarchaeota archaeon]MBU1623086.1 hypothetical protein [Nanoarchaeota archaeon]MBU1974174.1 hypothetical protein [Nanoarchaeota archaeon]